MLTVKEIKHLWDSVYIERFNLEEEGAEDCRRYKELTILQGKLDRLQVEAEEQRSQALRVVDEAFNMGSGDYKP